MKIAILTPLIGEKYINRCKYGTLSKEFYCSKNNYDLIIANEQDYNNIAIKNKQFGWTKVYKLLEIFDSYDYIFVSDADVSIMNYNLKLEKIINEQFDSNTLMIITRDQNNINSGNLIVKGKNNICKKYINVWKACLPNNYPQYIGHQDQPALINLIKNTEFKQYVKIIDQSIINSYPNKIKDGRGQIRPFFFGESCIKYYKKNDLLIHYAGFSCFGWDFSYPMKVNYYKSLKYLEEK